MVVRRALNRDVAAATETIALAFADDPVWSVALARPDGRTDHVRPYWRRFVESAQEQGGLWVMDAAAVSVWIPPDGEELAEPGIATLERFNLESLGVERAREIHDLYQRFEASHPRAEAHAYLSLLATHPDQRGRGHGQALLRENLVRWDGDGVPAYLESTNPANDHRYERAAFRRVGGFRAVIDDAPITTMWRVAGGSPAPAIRQG